MPDEWRKRLTSLELSDSHIETLLDAEVEFGEVSFLPLIETNLEDKEIAKFLANWQVNVFIPLLREGTVKLGGERSLKLEVAIYHLVRENKLSSTSAKALFEELIASESLPEDIEEYASDKGYIQVSDEGAIAKIVEQVLAENEKAANDVKNGEMRAIGFLVGQVMKLSQGKANPALATELIKKQLGL